MCLYIDSAPSLKVTIHCKEPVNSNLVHGGYPLRPRMRRFRKRSIQHFTKFELPQITGEGQDLSGELT